MRLSLHPRAIRRLMAGAAFVLGGGGLLHAGTIQIVLATRVSALPDGFRAEIEITNHGDEPALSVVPTVDFRGTATVGAQVPIVPPSGASRVALEVRDREPRPGTWPVLVRVAYTDANQHPFEALHATTARVGPVATEGGLTVELSEARIESSGRIAARVVSQAPGTAVVRFVAPSGLTVAPREVDLQLTPGAAASVATTLRRAGAPSSSRLPVIAVAETDGEDGHRTALATARIDLAPERTAPSDAALLLLLLALVAGALASGLRALRRRLPSLSRRRPVLRLAVDAAAILAPTLYLASLFPRSLMLLDTTAAGGDMGSHNYAAACARALLSTQHRITGWVPANYCGFPLFQMYFPLPFALMAALAAVVPPSVAFKLVTVLGVVTLPAAAALALRGLGIPFPGPALGAILTLPFLLQNGNSMWGGNLASTLAGEFSYSISLPLALAYLGLHQRALVRFRVAVLCAVLVALVALTHAYTVLWVALTVALAAVLRGEVRSSVVPMGLVWMAGAALCGSWLLPLVWYSPWTTAFGHVWTIGSVAEVVPRPLWPVVGLLALSAVFLAMRADVRRVFWHTSSLLVAATAAALLAYAAAPNFGVVDVRFLPFAQLSLCLLAAAAAGHVLAGRTAAALWVAVAFVGAVLLVRPDTAQLASWVQWNYEGFEAKPFWPVYRGLAEELRGDVAQPRVVYEHAPENEALGTIRAFENLPLFSGRSTLEGVNMQASVTSPFIFYIQSEVSQAMSCPFGEWGCSRTDLAAGLEHLRMMNVSDLILRSAALKESAAVRPDLVRRGTYGPYEVYRVTPPPSGYAIALAEAPYAVVTREWKTAAYRWFKRARSGDPVPVFVSDRAGIDGRPWAGVFTELPDPVPHVTSGSPPTLSERVEAERVTVTGCRPGQPVLVRISYHPRWRSTGGERVFLAGPGFMLVFPARERLELVYSGSAVTATGNVLTLLSAIGLALVALRRASDRTVPDAQPTIGRPHPAVLVAGLVGVVLVVGAGIRARGRDADSVYRHAQRLYDQGDLDAARRSFERARALAPLSNTAIHSTYYESIVLYRQQRWDEARQAFQRLLDTFPEAQAAAEAMYHIGLCWERTGHVAEATGMFEATQARFPATPWARYAAERMLSARKDR